MKAKYKLVDRNLIRNFGGVNIELEKTIGDRFVAAGKAISADRNRSKMTHEPPNHKAVFHAPEDKAIQDMANGDITKYPGPEDKLFPHIIK